MVKNGCVAGIAYLKIKSFHAFFGGWISKEHFKVFEANVTKRITRNWKVKMEWEEQKTC